MLGLREGKRLRTLSTANDVEWLLQHPGCRNQYPHITALALRRDVLLLASAAKKFVEGAAKDVALWSVLRSPDKDYLELMERVRSDAYEPCDDVGTIVPPHALPPPPQNAARTSNDGRAAAGPLGTSHAAGACCSCDSTSASICASCGRGRGVASAETAGGAARDAGTGGGTEGDARQISYAQAPSDAAAAANLQPVPISGIVGDSGQQRGARLGRFAPSVKGVAASGVNRLAPGVGRMTPGVWGVTPGVGPAGVSQVAQGAGGIAPCVGGVAPRIGRVVRAIGWANMRMVRGVGGTAPCVGGVMFGGCKPGGAWCRGGLHPAMGEWHRVSEGSHVVSDRRM